MHTGNPYTRRRFLWTTATAGGTAILSGLNVSRAGAQSENNQDAAEVTPSEDLMYEHGVIERMLLIYETASQRILNNQDIPVTAVAGTAGLMREFGEDYHERLEEQHIFPQFETTSPHAELVQILKRQHNAGRRMTDVIMRLSANGQISEPQRIASTMQLFVRMYQPHIARENSVLFRAFQSMLSAEEYRQLGGQFEEQEEALFGENGFQDIVDRVSHIEEELGIDDLSQFTPTI